MSLAQSEQLLHAALDANTLKTAKASVVAAVAASRKALNDLMALEMEIANEVKGICDESARKKLQQEEEERRKLLEEEERKRKELEAFINKTRIQKNEKIKEIVDKCNQYMQSVSPGIVTMKTRHPLVEKVRLALEALEFAQQSMVKTNVFDANLETLFTEIDACIKKLSKKQEALEEVDKVLVEDYKKNEKNRKEKEEQQRKRDEERDRKVRETAARALTAAKQVLLDNIVEMRSRCSRYTPSFITSTLKPDEITERGLIVSTLDSSLRVLAKVEEVLKNASTTTLFDATKDSVTTALKVISF